MWTSCEDKNGIPPKLSIEIEAIQTYPGDEILIQGTAGAVNALKSVEIVCEAWNIRKSYDIPDGKLNVLTIDYKFTIPNVSIAEMNQTLRITVVDVDGNISEKEIPISFIADETAPVFSSKPATPAAVDFVSAEGVGNYFLRLTVTDDRALSDLQIAIPDIGYMKDIPLSGKTQDIVESIPFHSLGSFDGTLTLKDKTGNQSIYAITFITLNEDGDPISDYPYMYLIDTSDSPANYLHGYYKYMARTDAYKYTTKFYAPVDNTPIAFVPTRILTGDYYGVSPSVTTKLLNKNGYVVPITLVHKGYYEVEIDIQNKSYVITSYTPAPDYTGLLCITGINGWSLTPNMVNKYPDNDYLRTLDVEVVQEPVSLTFTTPAWNPIFRAIMLNGQGGGTFLQNAGWTTLDLGNFSDNFQGPGFYTITFDLETYWATVSQKH
ncbi:hypothetical protein AGMMS50239_31910 [Bacteroidia bacterium]|nr:hypothetical protein AGMMS50239_31890 [Bacteroidia bacterium]GHT67895.1 hypothetical protein AGMMS50239_31910 [Bacteroidia bacterium]